MRPGSDDTVRHWCMKQPDDIRARCQCGLEGIAAKGESHYYPGEGPPMLPMLLPGYLGGAPKEGGIRVWLAPISPTQQVCSVDGRYRRSKGGYAKGTQPLGPVVCSPRIRPC